MKLCDRGDGVHGHYCIGRKVDSIYWQYWNEYSKDWSAFGTLYVGKSVAMAKLKELKIARKNDRENAIKRPSNESIKKEG